MKAFYINEMKFNTTNKEEEIIIKHAPAMRIKNYETYAEFAHSAISFGVKSKDLDKKVYVTISESGEQNRLGIDDVFEIYNVNVFTRTDGICILDTKREIFKALNAQIQTNTEIKKYLSFSMKNYKLEEIIVKKSLAASGVWFSGSGMKKLGLKAEAIFSDNVISSDDYKRNLRIGGTISIVMFKITVDEVEYTVGITEIGGIILYSEPDTLEKQLKLVEYIYDNILK
ncbi:MAG: hypothetical protein PQJ58_15050 [Spirochaetales bacterium]|nr:hypothetical protein [Spirochaetales bacterium]